MSSRGLPLARIGAVNVLAPTASSPYYRLTWTQPDGRPGRTSGSTSLEAAKAKAAALDASLQRAAGGRAVFTLEEIVDDYLSSPVGRNQKTGGDWSSGQVKQVRAKLRRCLRGFEAHRAMDVDRDVLDLMRRAGGTRTTRKENATVLRGLLRWGYQQGYFTAAQSELLPTNVTDLVGTVLGTEAPKRGRNSRAVGASAEYIGDEDAPSPDQIRALGDQFEELFPSWGRLAVELAAAAGPRWGEQYQLTADDIVLARKRDGSRVVRIKIDWQIDGAAARSAGADPRKRPKGDKTRVAVCPTESVTGYAVAERLLERAEQAREERRSGTNPEALLFPTAKGLLWHYTAWKNDFFDQAAIAAGWPYTEWEETKDVWNKKTKRLERVTRDRIQFEIVWHGLRHRFARTAIDVHGLLPGELMMVGGWESEAVVKETYYNTGAEHQESAEGKIA